MKEAYTNEKRQMFFGEEAKRLLDQKNDIKFYNENESGIHRVDKERWSEAQEYEKDTWISNPHLDDDRNSEHFLRFDSLQKILEIQNTYENIIELGCGPFTNLRLMSPIIKPKKIKLLDPLINEYLKLPNCTYKNNTLNGCPVDFINSPIEEYKSEIKYDLVIMINVIEHCYDVELIFQKINSILKKDGIFIFSDVFFENGYEMANNTYDAGHPLRLSKTKLDFLLEDYETIYEKYYHGLYSQDWRNDIYYIGKKIT